MTRLLAAALVLFAATDAAANGRLPQASQLVVAPDDPQTILVRTTFGLVLSRDGGQSWTWICEAAVGYGGVEDPSVALLGGGHVLAGLVEGLAQSNDLGCAWSFAKGALDGAPIVDVARPTDARTVLAVAQKYVDVDDAGTTRYASILARTSDGGGSWTTSTLPIDPTIFLLTLDTSPADPRRIYLSGTRGREGVLLTSADDGASFVEHAFPEKAPYIAAVDPKDPARIYVRTAAQSGGRVYASDDGGAMSRVALELAGPVLGFALSADGTRVYAGGPVDGLFTANRTDLAFAKRAAVPVACLATSGAILYACAPESSGFSVGASNDDGAAFAPIFTFARLGGPLACASGGVCVAAWPGLRDQLGIAPPQGQDAGPARPLSAAGGCSHGRAAGLAAPFVVILLALGLRRRRR